MKRRRSALRMLQLLPVLGVLAIAIFLTNSLAARAAGPADGAASDSLPAKSGMLSGNRLWQTLERGGKVMYVILGASVIGLAFVLESAVKTRRCAILPPATAKLLAEHRGLVGVEKALAGEKDSAARRILKAGHYWRHGTSEQVQAAIEEAVDEELWQMRRSIRPIGIIANTTPLLGLLGTVTGIIKAFDVVAQKGALGDPGALAGGISEALLTTCFGLIVAIPMLLFFHYFAGWIETNLRQCEALAKENLIVPPQDDTAPPSVPAKEPDHAA